MADYQNNINEIKRKAKELNNDSNQNSEVALPYQKIDIEQFIEENPNNEAKYIAEIYKNLLYIHRSVKDYKSLRKDNVSLKDVKEVIPQVKRIYNCIADFENKCPEYQESTILKQSYYLIDTIISEIDIVFQKSVKHNQESNKWKFIVITFSIIAVLAISIVILLKELKVF